MALGKATWAAGLQDGKIKDSSGNLYDINAIVTADGDPKMDEIEIKGDDEKKTTFVSGISEDLTVVANALSFDVIQAITGNTYASSATGIDIPLGTDSEENPPFVELEAFSQAKNEDGTAVTLKKVWHKVQFYSIKLSQAGEKEFNVELKGRAYQTELDIEGGSLATKRVATVSIYS